MKNIIKAIALFTLTILLSVSLFAADTEHKTYEKNKVTVIFPDNNFTELEKEKIVTYLTTGNQITPQNILCNILGHNMVLTGEGIKTITHRVRDTAPRCLEQTYDIYSCSRCSEKSSKLIGARAISCCP